MRFEAKYLLDRFSYHRVVNDLRGLARRDHHGDGFAGGRYPVRSLYFDTVNYTAYVEKMAGVTLRNKLRLRSYGQQRHQFPFIKVEQKQRHGRFIHKLVTKADISQYDRFMESGRWGETDDGLLQDFEKMVRIKNLKPMVLVAYEREAWSAKDGSGVRLSFDHDVRYGRCKCLFDTTTRLRKDLANRIVFEIKASRDDIGWVNRLVQRQDLGPVPNSKYVNGIDHTSQAIWV
ncbi:MAG: polyphosphate polymerase domain-containing protein [Magnetococcales bacterium]|nr:polyphosphate polymerase domain-containing protein [Magnetococcales bacterium]